MGQITLSDLLSQETRRNPAAFYARLREQEPLTYVTDFGAWIATTYDDVIALLKDPRLTKDRQKVSLPEDGPTKEVGYDLGRSARSYPLA